jgi:hypothetical protein
MPRWSKIFKVLKENNYYLVILYQGKIVFKTEGKIKLLSEKQNVRQSSPL